MSEKRPKKKKPLWFGFVTAAPAAMAGGAAAHPFDLLKVRMQIQGEGQRGGARKSTVQMLGHVTKTEGPQGLLKGMSASVVRQFVYSGTRFGCYDIFKSMLGESSPGNPLPLYKNVAAAASAGAIGAFVGNPTDVAMVRMQADGKLPLAERRNYRHVGDAIVRIVREEGLGRLLRGVSATVQRAMVVTIGQFAAYDKCKGALIRAGMADAFPAHLVASVGAAGATAALAQPLDVCRVRLMNMKEVNGGVPYSGLADCIVKTVKVEGAFGLYKGISATFARQLPFLTVTWTMKEQITKRLQY